MAYTEPMSTEIALLKAIFRRGPASLEEEPLLPFYAWMLVSGLVLFGAFLLWRFGYFSLVLDADRTWLSVVIMVLFVIVAGMLGKAAWRLSRLRQALVSLAARGPAGTLAGGNEDREIAEHFSLLVRERGNGMGEALHARLVERVHRGHHLGWFAADMLIRIGLIGTVIGFIMMLGTAYQLRQDDIAGLKVLLGTMGEGMQVALYTTLSGISGSLLLSVYCKILDRYADDLVAEIIRLAAKDSERPHEQSLPGQE